jgi:hypothetical protein
MAEPEPVTELSAFSSEDAIPTEWGQARRELQDAEVYWLSTVRPEGRPHVQTNAKPRTSRATRVAFSRLAATDSTGWTSSLKVRLQR